MSKTRCPDCGLVLDADSHIVPLEGGGFVCPDCHESRDPLRP